MASLSHNEWNVLITHLKRSAPYHHFAYESFFTPITAADPHAYKPQRKIAPFSSRSPIKAEKSKSPPIMSNSLAHLSRVMQFSSSEEDHLEFPLEGFPTSMKTKNVNNQQEPLDTNCNIMISNPKVVQDITLHTRDSDEEQNDPDSGAFNSEDSCMTEDESEAENGQKYDEFDDDVAWDEISRDDSDDPTTVQRTEYKKSAITISRGKAFPLQTFSRLGQNGQNFAVNIFKCIFINETHGVLIQLSLKFVPEGSVDVLKGSVDNTLLVQVMVWHQNNNNPLSALMTQIHDAMRDHKATMR